MEIESSIIETGVDKLVSLVKVRGKIALSDAAKELGVSTTVVQEWVDFLEDEGIISVEYKLTKPFLVERKLTKKEVDAKAKEFIGKKDVFVRKAEVNLSFLEKQADELRKVKEEFEKLKKDLGLDLGTLKDELNEIERYQQLKEEVQKQAEEQKKEAQLRIVQLAKEIEREQKKYQEFVSEVNIEREQLLKEKKEAVSIEESEEALNARLIELKDMVGKLEKKLSDEGVAVKNSEAHIQRLNLLMEEVKQRVAEEKGIVEPLIEKNKEQERKILDLQDQVLKKISENEKRASNAKDLTKRFKVIFEKRVGALDLIYKVNKDRDELEKNLMELIRKAKSFQLTMKKGDVSKEMIELEKKFSEVNQKKSIFEEELKKLTSFFRM